jgi:hypothetical protein
VCAIAGELFTQLNALRDKIFPNWMHFAHRYCDARQGRFGLETKGTAPLCANALEPLPFDLPCLAGGTQH